MATHDYVIDNQTPANLRADLNNALQAIVTQNSGSSAPTTTFSNMLWYDTGNNQIKKRNEADSAWVTLGTIDEATGKFTPNAAITTSEIAAATLVTSTDTIATNDNDTTIPTSAAVKDYTDGLAIGIGQTWQGVSRSVGTSYQNTTGRPIMVAVVFRPDSVAFQVSVDNSTWINLGNGAGGSGEWGSTQAIIPNLWYYRVTGGVLQSWAELR